MYIHKHTEFFLFFFSLFAASCLEQEIVVRVANPYQGFFFFFPSIKERNINKILFEICLKIRNSRQTSIFWKINHRIREYIL